MASRGQVYRRNDRPGYYARFKHEGRYAHKGALLRQGLVTQEASGRCVAVPGAVPLHCVDSGASKGLRLLTPTPSPP